MPLPLSIQKKLNNPWKNSVFEVTRKRAQKNELFDPPPRISLFSVVEFINRPHADAHALPRALE
jgi:hypothetical protein